MKQTYKSKSVAVIDLGLFVELARTLTKYFGKVYYWSPWHSSFPSSNQTEIGEGLPGIERIDDYIEVVDDVDLFVFPDIYMGKAQEYLESIGQRVWGSRRGDETEIWRKDAKKHFKKLGIPQGPYEVVEGISKLREYLKGHKGKVWVKIEKTRGDTETFPVEKYELSKNEIDGLEFRLGPKAEIITFIVEDHLKDSIDLAIDTYCINGEYPELGLLGTEEKGECYVCKRQKFTEPRKACSLYIIN